MINDHIVMGAIPGTFFWRPRLGIDLAIPSTEPPIAAYKPNKQNIQAGIVVLVEGYDIMTSILGLLRGAEFAKDDENMDPASGLYYTGIYRWILRTLDLFPHWLRGNFHDALGVWHSRFKHMDAEVPGWMRKLLPWVHKDSWDKEHTDLSKYRKFSESAYSQFYRFPSKTFNNFNSFLPESVEEFIFSSASRETTPGPVDETQPVTDAPPVANKKQPVAKRKRLSPRLGRGKYIISPYNPLIFIMVAPLQKLRQRNKNRESFIVIVNSYDVGITALATAGAVQDQTKFPQLDPKLAYYHTTAWRWTLRQLILYPDIFYKKFYQLHKVWRRRFYYEDVFVPEWLKKMLIWVDNTSWDKEENMTMRYNIYAKREFDKTDRYSPKKFVSNESFSNSTSMYYPGNFTNTLYDEGLPIQVPKAKNNWY
ncbi:uncharacterized protein LOC134755107 [Cydia strobilella]|uniref:uncharacterized protein LOC134755107 n=1 Tax=Cydia strobilella TaxID=1100964 RepID=UPI003004D636